MGALTRDVAYEGHDGNHGFKRTGAMTDEADDLPGGHVAGQQQAGQGGRAPGRGYFLAAGYDRTGYSRKG